MHLQTSQPVGNQSPLSYAFIATTISWTRPTYQPTLFRQHNWNHFNKLQYKLPQRWEDLHRWSYANSSVHTASSHSSYRHYDHEHVSPRWLYFQELVLYADSPKMQPHISIQSLDASTDQHWVDPSVNSNSLHLCQLALSVSCTLLSFCMRGIYEMICLNCCVKPAGCFIFCEWRVEICSSHTMFTHIDQP